MTYNPKERQEMPILSNGKRPYIVKMPNEPNPLTRYEEEGIYEFRGGEPTDPNNYSNYLGQTLVDHMMDRNRSKAYDLAQHSFRSKDTLVNWLNKNGAAACSIPEGVYMLYGYAGSDEREYRARKEVTPYLQWKEGDVYRVAFVDDPAVQEPYAETVYLDDPRMLPEGAYYGRRNRLGKTIIPTFYGDGAERAIEKKRKDAADIAERRYSFKGTIENLTHEQAMMFGYSGEDLRVDQSVYLSQYNGNKVKGVYGDIRRTKNIRRGR